MLEKIYFLGEMLPQRKQLNLLRFLAHLQAENLFLVT